MIGIICYLFRFTRFQYEAVTWQLLSCQIVDTLDFFEIAGADSSGILNRGHQLNTGTILIEVFGLTNNLYISSI